jgi:hypothetical protein
MLGFFPFDFAQGQIDPLEGEVLGAVRLRV